MRSASASILKVKPFSSSQNLCCLNEIPRIQCMLLGNCTTRVLSNAELDCRLRYTLRFRYCKGALYGLLMRESTHEMKKRCTCEPARGRMPTLRFMIKELLRQIKAHIKWFFESPTQIVRIMKSFWSYLWKGYSEQDRWSVDYYLMKKFNEIMDDFIKDAEEIGYPADLTHEQWITMLKQAKDWSDLILADDYSSEAEYLQLEKVRKEWLNFMYERFFALWT